MGRLRTSVLQGGPPVDPADGSDAEGDSVHDDLIWLALPAAAGLVVAAMIWLAPPFGRLVHPAPSWKPFPTAVQAGLIRPEPVEHTRFLLAVVAPFLVVALWLALHRRLRRRGRTARVASWFVLLVHMAIAALLVACWIAQKRAHEWFADTTLLVATAIGFALYAMAWRGWIVPARPAAGGRGRRLLGLGIAFVLTGYWLLSAVYRTPTAVNMPNASGELLQIQFVQDEFVSVLNGRNPLVDFSAQYAKLLPFATAPVLAVLSPSVGTTTCLLAALGLLGLLAAYGMFVVLTEDALAALVLYVPFLALTLFTLASIGDERTTLATLFGVVPIRVLGPFVLGWLCARQQRRDGESARVLLFTGAGLVAINNTEYGAASFVALGFALWCAHDERSLGWPRARRLLGQAFLGAAISVVGVSLLALVRSGSLPDVANLSNLTRVFAVEGFGMEPIRPTLGLHIVIYLTFVASLITGIVGATRSDHMSPQARVQHGLLIYSGLLGLGAGAYWAGRSDPLALFGMFPTWGLSVAILCWAVLRGAAARPQMSHGSLVRWALPTTGVLVTFGLMVTVVVQVPSPASQLRRFTADGPAIPQYAGRVQFIAARTLPGEPVAILAPAGHLMARDAGIVDVSPYASEASIAFYEQMDLLLGIMRRNGATKLFVGPTWPETSAYLAEKHYVTVTREPAVGLTEWEQQPRSAG